MSRFDYIPALRYHFLTSIYDAFIKIVVPEKKIKNTTIALCGLQETDKVLDYGCGTGTMLHLLKKTHPTTPCTGIDIDPKMLEVAKKKLQSFRHLELVKYDGHIMPFPSNSFTVVVSTWVFHHLTDDQKLQAFAEIYRVLNKNGKLIVADWGKPQNALMSFLFYILQIVDNFKTTQANREGRLPKFMEAANFKNIKEVGHQSTPLGTLTYHTATK